MLLACKGCRESRREPGVLKFTEVQRKTKDENDKRKLTAYEYDTYTKIEIDVDNISINFGRKNR